MIVCDSAGITARLTPLRDLEPGDAITEGWRPWLVVETIEHKDDLFRVRFVGGHSGPWLDPSTLYPVEVVS